MNYKEVIAFLYSQLPVFHREGKKAYKPGLENILALCELFGNPQIDLKCLHIAGTNGKGSSSHFMASILQEAGYKVGLYTSPHLKSFTERIKINGIEIDENWIVNFVEKNLSLLKTIHASFFEWTVIMAFCYFKEQKIDWAIIETGLGGRLDSTNIINPAACLITNISWDHQDILGDTLEKIAHEKAGIIKSNIPVTISEKQVSSKYIFLQKSQEVQASIQFAEDLIEINEINQTNKELIIKYQTLKWSEIEIESPYSGKYQIKNIRGILAWCEQLIDHQILNISMEQIQNGIKHTRVNTQLKGRWEILNESPMVVADTAHNVSGLSELMDQINNQKYNQLFIILGMVSDKDIQKVLSILPQNAKYIFSQANNPRAINAKDLQELGKKFNLIGEVSTDVNIAFSNVLKIASKKDFILITGSTYLVAEIDKL
jgi:dihydrofolate synthase/folylpolyglutamate synthase